ncbi:MAG: SurA N-terminal domain-containing protein [Campylobacterota bacterium]|nr:SurA N-terminal domain-containing protein [Campylobacterota bacterium]
MQRHKKWLIVTIWISTIAFVGAGFVGWGSYDYGKSDSAVAVVGKKEVPMRDLQNEYSTLYSQYQEMLGDKFNQELAKQFKLEDAALQRIIQKYLLLNYAEDLGLITTDVEVAKELVKITAFFKDGKFDKNTYMSVLKQNRRSITEFEAQLKQDLLIQKVQSIFNIGLSSNEIKNLNGLLFSQDKVSVKIIDGATIKITPTSKDLTNHWEKIKENYKTPLGYEINYTKVENIDNKTKKEMKKVALKQYLNLKKNKETFREKTIIFENSNFLTAEDFTKLIESKNNEVLKPLYKDNNYYVLKLLKKVEPQVLPYKDVKVEVNDSFIAQQKKKTLENMAQKNMIKFEGTDLGYLSRNSIPKVNGLGDEDIAKLVENIFASTKQINYITLGSKVAVYKITDTKLALYEKSNDEMVKSALQNIKANSISSALLEKLKLKYDVKSYMKSN